MGANHGDLTFLGFDSNVAKSWTSEHLMHGIISQDMWVDDVRALFLEMAGLGVRQA